MFFRSIRPLTAFLGPAVLAAWIIPSSAAEPSAAPGADLLAELTPPEGFVATVFATPSMANYPVFVAATADGTLFVSSDGNGSVGRDPHRGRVLRLRDTDDDGTADEVKEFVKDLDSPRGLVWVDDRLDDRMEGLIRIADDQIFNAVVKSLVFELREEDFSQEDILNFLQFKLDMAIEGASK